MPTWQQDDPRLLTARLVLWIFGLDDLVDTPATPFAVVQARLALYRRIAVGMPITTDFDDLSVLLSNIRHALADRPLWSSLHLIWTTALTDLLDAMLAERSPAPPLSFTTYMERGTASIGTILDGWTVLLLLDDASAMTQLPQIQAALQAGAAAVRLANDLRTAEKEAGEGKVNALTLLGSRAQVEAALTQAETDWHTTIAQVTTQTTRFEQCLTQTVETILAVYHRSDYHRFTAHE